MRVKKAKVIIPNTISGVKDVDEDGNRLTPEQIVLKKKLEKYGFFDKDGNWRQK